MTLYETPQDPDELHKLFLKLWSKAQEGPAYEKAEWLGLQGGMYLLMGLTPPADVESPPAWIGNGTDETVRVPRPHGLDQPPAS